MRILRPRPTTAVMTLLGALLLFLCSTTVLLLVLASLVVGRKIARDRAEVRSGDRRKRYAQVLRDRRTVHLVGLIDEVAADHDAQTDLMVELGFIGEELPPESRRCLVDAAHDFGLAAHLIAHLDHRNPVVRGRSGLLLARLGLPEAPAHLRPLLNDPDADVRLVACAGLGLTQGPDGARALIGALRERLLAPERLMERLSVGSWAVGPMLEALAAEPRDGDGGGAFRAHLARALGLAGDPAASPALVGLLCAGAEEERISAARALGDVGGPEAIGALVVALDDEAWPVRAQAARALGRLDATDRAEDLARGLTDGAWWVRAAAAEALAALGPAGHRVLRRALHSDDRFARDRAREQLALVALADDVPVEDDALELVA